MEISQLILDKIFDFFVKSRDFNGIPLTKLADETKTDYNTTVDIVKQLVTESKASIQSSINPHIISLGHFTIETQLNILEEAKKNTTEILSKISDEINISYDSHLVCVYPSPQYLKDKRDVSEFSKSPFALQLALGEPQLKPLFFEIEVLDRYFKDPRFSFVFKDHSGQISYTEDENNKPSVEEEDQIFLKTFGLGVDENRERVAVVYLRYLNDLTPDHQVYWKSKEAKRECQMLQEYYVNTIEGDWTNSHSVFSAFIGEQKALNDLTKEIFNKPIFNTTFERDTHPKEFTFFFIPTLKNYNDFVLLLDKMISDNINKDFFSDKGIEMFDYKEIGNGIVERKDKGTLRLFEEWLTLNFNTADPQSVIEVFKPLKKIRRERQNPAHRISENIYDKNFTTKQTELIKEAYFAIRALRQVFQKHPKAKLVKVEKWLDEGQVKVF